MQSVQPFSSPQFRGFAEKEPRTLLSFFARAVKGGQDSFQIGSVAATRVYGKGSNHISLWHASGGCGSLFIKECKLSPVAETGALEILNLMRIIEKESRQCGLLGLVAPAAVHFAYEGEAGSFIAQRRLDLPTIGEAKDLLIGANMAARLEKAESALAVLSKRLFQQHRIIDIEPSHVFYDSARGCALIFDPYRERQPSPLLESVRLLSILG